MRVCGVCLRIGQARRAGEQGLSKSGATDISAELLFAKLRGKFSPNRSGKAYGENQQEFRRVRRHGAWRMRPTWDGKVMREACISAKVKKFRTCNSRWGRVLPLRSASSVRKKMHCAAPKKGLEITYGASPRAHALG